MTIKMYAVNFAASISYAAAASDHALASVCRARNNDNNMTWRSAACI